MSTAHLGRVRATAFAKLTLTLNVLGPRRDDGFHELEALTVPIGQPRDTIEAVAVPYPPGVTFEVVGGDRSVPAGHQNLAMRAAEGLLIRAGRAGHGVQLSLRKRIPTARGLGGGSSDAAAAMLAVHRLLEVDVSEPDLFLLAAQLGSDVPFFLAGGAAWMRGRRAWDKLGGPRSSRTVPAPPPIDALTPTLTNDLEPAAEIVEPRLRPLREQIEDNLGRDAIMAGSGPTYVVLADGPHGLPDRAHELSAAIGVPVVAAASVSKGVRIEA